VSHAERVVRDHVIDGKDVLIAVAASGTTHSHWRACARPRRAAR
jgi:N-acetylmuramic acid 6-phosphate (MurNAc-6-P) etherase